MDTHGTARWSAWDDLQERGWLSDKGLLLGSVREVVSGWREKVRTHDLRQADDTHHLVVAGNGGGKFVSSLGVLLYDLIVGDPAGCCVVVDPKGEALLNVGKLAVKPFDDPACPSHYDVRWLDPFNASRTGLTWSVNPLATLGPDNPVAVEEAKILANSIISIGGKDASHWDESARNFLRALILYVAQDPDEGMHGRDLVRVRQLAASGWEQTNAARPCLQKVCEVMAEWDFPQPDGSDANGTAAIRNGARTLMALHHETRESVMSGIYRDTEWLDSPAIKRVVQSGATELDVRALAESRTMIFLVLPDKMAEQFKVWLRLVVTAFSSAFKERGAGRTRWDNRRHVFVDEFPNLGHMEMVKHDVAVARGFGVQYHLYCQTIGQLKSVYGDVWQTFVGNSIVQAFAMNDLESLEFISKSLGVRTFAEEKAGLGISAKGEISQTISEDRVKRNLLNPEELRMQTHKETGRQVMLHAASWPVLCNKIRVFDYPAYKRAEAFTLAEVVATCGRAPRDAAERARFSWWS